jgi:hypothetical protein
MPIPPDIGMTGPQIATALAEEKRAEMDRLGGPVRLGKPGTTSRFPSRDLSSEKEGASVFMRVVVAPKTVYQLGVVAVGVSPEPGRTRFVDSFRVLAR